MLQNSSNADYHANRSHLSSSMLKLILKDVKEFERQWVHGQLDNTQKDAFTEGSFVHTLVLEPHKVQTDYAVFPGMRKSGAAWEEFKVANEGKTLLSTPQMLRCQKLYKAYEAMQVATELVRDGLPEHTMTATILGVPVKSRADYIVPKKYIVDVKTTSYPSDTDLFKQTVGDFKYELSAALYCQIAYETYGCLHDFYWLVLSKADNQCHVYKASSDTLSRGAALVAKALVKYKKCSESGLWIDEQPKPVFDTRAYQIEEV